MFVGAIHHTEPNAAPAANPAETRQQLIGILARYSRGDPYIDAALANLRGRPSDWVHVLVHWKRGNYRQLANTRNSIGYGR